MTQQQTTPETPETLASHLSPKQLQAASLLAAGHSYAAVAKTLDLARATLFRWRQDPHFAALLHQQAVETADLATARANALLTESLNHMTQELHNSADPKARTRMAVR